MQYLTIVCLILEKWTQIYQFVELYLPSLFYCMPPYYDQCNLFHYMLPYYDLCKYLDIFFFLSLYTLSREFIQQFQNSEILFLKRLNPVRPQIHIYLKFRLLMIFFVCTFPKYFLNSSIII